MRIFGANLDLLADVRTDKNGMARLHLPTTEATTLTVTASGFAAHVAPAFSPRASEVGTVVLQQESTCEVLAVRGDTPVSSERVTLELHSELDAWLYRIVPRVRVTDPDGRAVFSGLPAGRYTFCLGSSQSNEVAVQVGGKRVAIGTDRVGTQGRQATVHLAVGSHKLLRIDLPPPASVEGRLLAEGEPAGGVPLLMLPDDGSRWFDTGTPAGPRAVTDPRGHFAFSGLDADAYVLLIYHPSYAMRFERKVDLRAGSNQVVVDLSPATVSGMLRSPEGTPVPGTRVSCRTRSTDRGGPVVVGASPPLPAFPLARCESSPDGSYTLAGVVPDAELLIAVVDDYAEADPQSLPPLRPGERHVADITVKPAGSVVVSVVDSTQAPQASAVVSMFHEEFGYRHAVSNEDGTARFQGVPVGEWNVEVLGFAGESMLATDGDVVRVMAGETARATLHRREGSR